MAISLTESAAGRVREHLARRGQGLGLRLGVKPAGCSGFSYVIDYADAPGPDDVVFEEHGVKVFVDVRQGLNESFRFDNPKVRGECGCGESFTV
jgi:iron-sulfur cluster assembly protein